MVDNVQGAKLYAYIQKNKKQNSHELIKSKNDFCIMDRKQWNQLMKNEDRNYIKDTYKQALEDCGESFNKYLDEKFGNNDGILEYEEFKKADLFNAKKDEKFLKYAFRNFDVNGDNQISSKEWAAFLFLVDKSINDNRHSCPDAKIDAYSLMAGMKEINRKDVGHTLTDTFKRIFGDV